MHDLTCLLSSCLVVLALGVGVSHAGDIVPPSGLSGRALKIGIIGLWWTSEGRPDSFTVQRSRDGRSWVTLASEVSTPKARGPVEFVDTFDLQREATYFYRVARTRGHRTSPYCRPVWIHNSANLVANGDFELDSVGAAESAAFATASNAEGRLKIVEGGRPEGRKCLMLVGDATAPIIRLHTPRYMVVPRRTMRVRMWSKHEPSGVAHLGGEILTPDFDKCKKRKVSYFQSRVIKRTADGWELMMGWNAPVPSDAGWIQLWCLGWRTRGRAWADNMEVTDCTLEWLSHFDSEKVIKEVEALLAKLPPQKPFDATARKAIARVEQIEALLADPRGKPISEINKLVDDLAEAAHLLEESKWDLKLLSLKE